MSDYIKIISAVILCCFVTVIIREIKREYSIIVALAGVSVVIVYAVKNFSVIIGQINSFISENGVDSTGITILLKAVGISVVCQFAGEMCTDTNNRLLQFSVELIGKTAILLTSLPLVGSILKIVSG